MKYTSNEIRRILKDHGFTFSMLSRITNVNERGIVYFVQGFDRSNRSFENFMLEKALDIIVSKNLVCPGIKDPKIEDWIKNAIDIMDRDSKKREFEAINSIMDVINNPKRTEGSTYYADDISEVLPSYGKDRYIRHARKQASGLS